MKYMIDILSIEQSNLNILWNSPADKNGEWGKNKTRANVSLYTVCYNLILLKFTCYLKIIDCSLRIRRPCFCCPALNVSQSLKKAEWLKFWHCVKFSFIITGILWISFSLESNYCDKNNYKTFENNLIAVYIPTHISETNRDGIFIMIGCLKWRLAKKKGTQFVPHKAMRWEWCQYIQKSVD